MRKLFLLLCIVCVCLLFSGCYVHRHTIGSGQHAGTEIVDHQWYALWGLVHLSEEKDGGKIAGTDRCEIITQFGPIDAVITWITGGIIGRRSLIIRK